MGSAYLHSGGQLAPLDLRDLRQQELGQACDPQGRALADPRSVMEGEGRYSRAIAFRSPEQIDADVLAPILRGAAARQTEM